MSTCESPHVKSWPGLRRWMLVSILCAVAMPIIVASFPEHVGKGSYATEYYYDPYDSLRMLLFFVALFASGAAFGAAIGSVIGDMFTCILMGVFVWPVLLLFLMPVLSLIFWTGADQLASVSALRAFAPCTSA